MKYPLVQSPKSSPRKKDNLKVDRVAGLTCDPYNLVVLFKPETSLYHETSNIEEILLKLKSLGVLEVCRAMGFLEEVYAEKRFS